MKDKINKILEFLGQAKNESLIASIALAAIWGIVECGQNSNDNNNLISE